jgi:hypothetical protein
MQKIIVFDLEFTELIPKDGKLDHVYIGCAATLTSDETVPKVWIDKTIYGDISERLSVSTMVSFVTYLESHVQNGYVLYSWGGAASDFRMLSKELPFLRDRIIQLCLVHYDIPFMACMHNGMMMGLSAASRAIGLEDKQNSSINVPELWRANKSMVMQHVSTDTYLTFTVVSQMYTTNILKWITQKGHVKEWFVHWRNVHECLQMPLPDVPFSIPDNMNPKLLSRWMFF